jgi:putative ABC transport system permease protein
MQTDRDMNKLNTIDPPRWPLKLLRFVVKKQYLEEIEGDMEEIFRDNLEQLTPRQARRMYTWEMLRLLRPILIKNLEALQHLTQFGMLKNYFKVSLRGLRKNSLNSFINIVGLSIAIGIAIFTYAFARWTFSTDQFHENKHSVYLTTFFADRDGTAQQFGKTPRPLGEMLREDFTHIKKVCRIEDRNVVVKHQDNVFHERVRYTDPEFLEMFTFPLKWGTSSSLKDLNSIILSEDMAVKYFGSENPVGQDIQVILRKDQSKVYNITGVAKEFPEARSMSFDFLVNIENLRSSEPGYDFQDWNAFVNATLIQVDNPADLKSIEQGMKKYRKLQNEAVPEDWAIASFAFEPLATLHETTANIRDDIFRSSENDVKSVIYNGVIGGFLLLLACFNYINIAIVSAAKRLKEIGVRKSIGATRRVVIVQFLAENVVITSFALVMGVTLAATVFIPWFEQQWDFSMGFKFTDLNLWLYLPAILFVTAVASGIYPAFYISKFHVVGILKGSIKFGNKNPLTKILLGFQLILACVFMTSAIVMTQNNNYLAERSWGYNQHDALYASVPDQPSYEQLHALIAQDPNVLSLSGSAHHLGKSNGTTVLHFPDRQYEVDQLSVEATYFETMGLKLKEGRIFNDHEGSDRNTVVVNEVLVKNMGWKEPLGQPFQIDSIPYEVIGVVKDFHSYSFFKPIKPTIFKVADKEQYRYLSLRVRSGAELKTYKTLQAKWAKLFPEIPFEGGYQEDVWAGYYEATAIYGKVWRAFAVMVVVMAGLGLYGLVTLNVSARAKEFSIRKVLGAGMKNILSNMVSQYLVLFAIAIVVGTPLSYMAIKFLLNAVYTVHMPITYASVAMAASMLILILVITISAQIRKVVRANPVAGLKVE